MQSLKKYYFGCSKCRFDQFGYDSDFAKVLKRACQLKFTLPTLAERTIINQLFLDLKSNGIWSKQDYILNFAYNNTALASFSLINWKNPMDTLASVVNGMTYTINGYKGNGIDGVINTPYIPSTYPGANYVLNNAGMGAVVYVDGTLTAVNRLIIYNSGGFSRITNINATQQRLNSGATSLAAAVNLSGTGYKGIFRNNSSSVETYNKSTKVTSSSTSTVVDNTFFRLFSQGQTNWGDIGESFVHFGGYLTETEKEALRTVYNTYMTNMGLTPIA